MIFAPELKEMKPRPRAHILLVCFAVLMVLVAVSCARKRKPTVQPSQKALKAIAPVCALEVSPTIVARGDRLGISAKASAPGFTNKKVTWEYRWEIVDASGRIVPVSGAGAAIDVPTARLGCGVYRVMSSVTATTSSDECSGDCVTTGQTTCSATFEVTEAPCSKVACEIIFAPRERLTFHAIATGVDNPTFTWTTTSGSLSSTTGAEVTLEPTGSWPSSVTVAATVSTDRTSCDRPCPGASSSISLAARQLRPPLVLAMPPPPELPPVQRPSAHRRMSPRSANQPTPPAGGEVDIDTQLEHLNKANIVFNTPESMSVGDTRAIQLLLGLNSVPELEQMIQEAGRIEHATNVRISNQMEAKLSGEGFSITEITPAVCAISMKEVNEWKWNIKAEKPGKHRLNLALNVILFIEGNQRSRTIKTFEKDIEVTVVEVPWSLTASIIDFIKSEWKWLWAVLVVPLAGWIWKRLRKPAGNA